MHEAIPSRTNRWAMRDDGGEGACLAFARRSLDLTAAGNTRNVIWHFAIKDRVRDLERDPKLAAVAKALLRRGVARVGEVDVYLQTSRMSASLREAQASLAGWWLDDQQILAVDTGHRQNIGALVSDGGSAPVWCTAFEVEQVGATMSIGICDPMTGWGGTPATVAPIHVEPEVQSAIERYSGPMTLNNGVGDSLASPLIRAARSFVRDGKATPEAVAVAALRAGWWPYKIPGLLAKVR